ncbi:MAG: LexA family transcriptional regulator [Prolixibacteraceae bacterium]|jgi:transcriptional regulator with XRE-family HTH domain|nr:LexA family transcriptional regulator [Prolixibacteraceae bacterium]
MNCLIQNIKYLRKREKLTQQQFADLLQIKRSLVGAYEEGRATPPVETMQKIAGHFKVSIDELINCDLETQASSVFQKNQKEWQVLPIVVDDHNRELIPIVPVKASAGYLNGLSDPEFIGSLPRFSIPVPELSPERTYRVFQIKGDSMLPVPSGAYIFCEFVADINDLKSGQAYLLITRDEGLVYKRIYQNGEDQLLLVSDNKEYSPYSIAVDALLEIWRARGVLSFYQD